MDFEHTEARRMLADTLDRFVRERYGFEARQRVAGSATGADRGAWQSLVDLGAVAVLFPEAVGGMGGSGFDIAVVFEALGRGLVVEPVAGALMAGQVLAATGGEAALATLRRLIDGEQIVVMAHEETDTGADVAGVGLPATRETAGWRLRGRKVVVHQAEMADAFVVSARSAGVPGDVDGLSLFLVPGGAPGLSRRGYPLIDGGRAAELTFDVLLPDTALLGTAGRAHAVLERAVGTGLVALAAEALGAMEVAKAATLEYLRTRKQFGVPIGSFQALQHRMADLLLEVEQARSAVINAAAALEGDPRVSRERSLSAAKVTVGRVGTLVAEESIQLHGGIGMSWELPLAHYAKRLVMIDHELGDEDQHLARYIALGRA